MSKISFINGGAASGKSRWAVSYFSSCDNVMYMCSADKMDSDIADRIKWIENNNYVEWDVKTSCKLDDPTIPSHKFLIFDSLAHYVSAVINEICPDASAADQTIKKTIEKKVADDLSALIATVQEADGYLIIISLETGFSVNLKDINQSFFREILGNVNQRVANMCNEVYLSASGIQFRIK